MFSSKRIRYFLLHLACSVILGLILVALVFLVWYPAPLASAEGVTTIFLMLLTIDVIVGPLLSLLVYKEGKNTLKMDLSVIVIVQILALSYGVYAIAQSRPAWIVQSGWLFEVVPANAIDSDDQKKAQQPYNHNSLLKPQWVAVDDQKNPKNMLAAPQLMPTTFTNVSDAELRFKQHAQLLPALEQFNDKEMIENVLKSYSNAHYWMPLRTSGIGLTILLDKNYNVIDIVDLRPWN